MTGPIGYYVHHHGDGHRQRALAIAKAAAHGRFTLIGTGLAGRTEGYPCLNLPDDRLTDACGFDGCDGADHRPQALHYAPWHHEGIRSRAALLTDWIARERPSLIIVDVSVEIAMLARLAATPTVYVRLGGLRDDPAHLDAFRGAKAVLAPFHESLDDTQTPGWLRCRTHYCAGLTAARPQPEPDGANAILFVCGKGGAPGDGDMLAAAARVTPEWNWRAIGPVSPPRSRPRNLAILGWVDETDPEIAAARIVIGAAGDGLVNAVTAAGRRFICRPEPRPFGEQVSKARRLAALGAAVVIEDWPTVSDWPGLIAAADDLDPRILQSLHDRDGVRHAAEFLIATAQEGMPRASK